MQTASEMEAAVGESMSRFQQKFMGYGAQEVQVHLLDDVLLVRLRGVLTAAEAHLIETMPEGKGRDLLKDARTQLIEAARPALTAMIAQITGLQVVSLHHDLSTVTGEEIVVFTLAGVPLLRANNHPPVTRR